MHSKNVFVGMSGGVDSSVSAALLKEQGFDVTGVFIKVWQADFLPCTWREERRDAMRAAASIGIPFLTLDLEKEYKNEVVDYMVREYGAGRIPNPDVMCNKYVKFGAFLDFAKLHGAEFIATGHYAQVVNKNDSYHLLMGMDAEKDQSYFLWTLTQSQLKHTLFPVGHFQKKNVRELALKYHLPNATKKDSQGLCFMGNIDMKEFLKHYLKTEKGDVLDISGHKIGLHDGAMLYAIGERHGFRTIKQSPNEPALFVSSKDIGNNTITVSPDAKNTMQLSNNITLSDVNNVSGRLREGIPCEVQARIRYRGDLFRASVTLHNSKGADVFLHAGDEMISVGQSMVFYDGDECIGGGVIS